MGEVRAARVVTDTAANYGRLSVRRFLAPFGALSVLLFVLSRLRATKPMTPRRRRGTVCPADPRTVPAADDPGGRLDAIAEWIGTPAGGGRVVARAPAAGMRQGVRVWEGSGELATRHIRIGRLLGAGLAGCVYEVQDDNGGVFVEKHYGPIPGRGRLGGRLAAAVFSLFRQAPLSFRELPAAAVTIHLTNRFIVAASAERFGRAITPALLYTRYDARSGGYVQAFEYVEGRPLRPGGARPPILGEAAVFLPLMRRWRDFVARELGFWGLARQVDPANVNAYSNVWVRPTGEAVLLDLVPGVPGFLEPRYLWWGLRRGQFPPFADAIDFVRLERWLERHPCRTSGVSNDLDLLRVAVERWQASEPRLFSSPLRPVRLLTDPRVRAATRAALLTHLEVKGALSPAQGRLYRERLAATGRFPKLLRHSVLKMAPLGMHRMLVEGAYAWQVARRMPHVPRKLARTAAAGASRVARRATGLLLSLVRHLRSRELRLRAFRTRVGGWIDSERKLGRLTEDEAARLRRQADDDEETADLAGLFVVHLSISAVKHSLLGPSALWIGLALATHEWWLALPAMVAPLLRVVAAAAMGFSRRPGLLMLCALPDIGALASPLYLSRRRTDLGEFIVRACAQKVALSIPAFGQRGGLLEIATVAAAQVLLIGPARVLPWAFLLALFGLLQSAWWAALLALFLYSAAIAHALLGADRSRRGHERLAEPLPH
jgi:hypothetical protein